MLDRDWHIILKRAWSVRLALISFVLETANITLQMIGTQLVVAHPVALSLASGLCAGGAIVARVVSQRNMPKEA